MKGAVRGYRRTVVAQGGEYTHYYISSAMKKAIACVMCIYINTHHTHQSVAANRAEADFT